MPAKKPQGLSNRHSTREEKDARESAEMAMTPATQLTLRPPTMLAKHKQAAAVWKRLIGLYGETEGTIITAFDSDLLAKYCLLEQECDVMQTLRDAVLKNYSTISGQIARMKPRGEDMKEFNKLMEQANALLARYQGLDARLDGKRKLLHALAQSLYLTPRSRAGVAPTEKEPPKPDSEMGSLLDE